MKPSISPSILVGRVVELLGQPIVAWKPAPYGADHIVLLATMLDGHKVVVKAGSEAHVDAEVLPLLRVVGVNAPTLLARTEIDDGHTVYPVVVMSHVEGQLLAEVPFPFHDCLPSLMARIHLIHRITTDRGAGPVMEVTNGEPGSWKAYLFRILSGDDPEFRWDLIQRDARFDPEAITRGIAEITERVARLPEPEQTSLLHGDLNPHNVFVDHHEVVGIVDWSYARFGDPLFDFARLRMNPFLRTNSEALHSYFATLKLDAAAREREQTYYLFNLLEYVNWYYLDHEFERVRDHLRLIS